MTNQRILSFHEKRLRDMREYCEKHKAHAPAKGTLYRAKLGGVNRFSSKGLTSLLRGDIVMVVSDPEVTWTSEGGTKLPYPEWTNLLLLHVDRVWPITKMIEDRWYVWFERVQLSET